MRCLRGVLTSSAVLLVSIYTLISLFLILQGRAYIRNKLEKFTQKKVAIETLRFIPPLTIDIKGLDIENTLKADSVVISGSITSIVTILTGNIVLNELRIVKPEFMYQRVPRAPQTVKPSSFLPFIPGSKSQRLPFRFVAKRIIIKDGSIDFIDNTAGPEGIKIAVKDINFKLNNIYIFPRSTVTNIELRGKIPWRENRPPGSIEADGWLNFAKRDMQLTFKIKDIDGVYLYPYYSNWVDLEKARIDRATLNFSSNIQGFNNNVTADCHLELADIVRKPLPPEHGEQKESKITNAVIGMFKALDQGKVVLDFTIRTKMDKPEFGFGNVKMAFENKISQGMKGNSVRIIDLLRLPSNIIQGVVRGTTDLSKSVIDGTFSVGQEVKKSIEETFKREKDVQPVTK